MNNDTQIMKGILEGCILKIADKEAIYGYKMVELLNEFGFEVNEATVYPILTRLQNKKMLSVEKRPSPLGPMRKYYSVTDRGSQSLSEFRDTWMRIKNIVNDVWEEEIK